MLTEQFDTVDDGLIFAVRLNGAGGAVAVGWAELEAEGADLSGIWCHLEYGSPRVRRWLKAHPRVSHSMQVALMAEEARPRTLMGREEMITTLRGVNTNPDNDPEDMVAMRMWCDGSHLITVRRRRLMTPRDILSRYDSDIGPPSIATLFTSLIVRLAERFDETVTDLSEQVDAVEETVESGAEKDLRHQLSQIRQRSVGLRRYMAPQRLALDLIWQEPPDWLNKEDLTALRETGDRTQRYLEEIDAIRERAVVLKDDIASIVAERMNRNTYALSVIAGIFLPLGFVTGLLGINVGGVPGVDSPMGFAIACLLMIVLVIFEVWLFKRLRWF